MVIEHFCVFVNDLGRLLWSHHGAGLQLFYVSIRDIASEMLKKMLSNFLSVQLRQFVHSVFKDDALVFEVHETK